MMGLLVLIAPTRGPCFDLKSCFKTWKTKWKGIRFHMLWSHSARGFTFFQGPPDIGFLQKGVSAFTSSLEDAGIMKGKAGTVKRQKVEEKNGSGSQVSSAFELLMTK